MALATLTSADPLQLGRFTILARLGGGGMGIVYLAEDVDGTPAAVKVVKGELADDPDFRARFRREVEAGRRVSGRCAARYLDADVLARAPWLATEFVPGPTLHAEIHRNGPMGGARLAGLAAGLADALAAIHAAGLVHRDLKPANVLLAPDGPKVIDFGIALASDTTMLTSTGVLVGSPSYMSPEQARGAAVGPEADIFAWGSCIVFAATGAPPFGEGQAAGVLYRVVNDPADLGDLALDPVLAPLVSRALNKDPAMRPTPAELFHSLSAAIVPATAGRLGDAAELGPTIIMSATALAGLPIDATAILARTWVAPVDATAGETLLSDARDMRAALPPTKVAERRETERKRNRRNATLFGVAMVAAVVLLLVVFDPFGRSDNTLSIGERSSGGTSTSIADGAPSSLASVPGATQNGSLPPSAGGPDSTIATAAGGGAAGSTTVATGYPGVVGPGGPIEQSTTAPATTRGPNPTTTLVNGATTTQAPTTTTTPAQLTCSSFSADRTAQGQVVAPAFDRDYRVHFQLSRDPGAAGWVVTSDWVASAHATFTGTGTFGSHSYRLLNDTKTNNYAGSTDPHLEHPSTLIRIHLTVAGTEVCATSFTTPAS